MLEMADPIIALQKLQIEVTKTVQTKPEQLYDGYHSSFDQPNGEDRYAFSKIINGEVQSLSIFAQDESFQGIPRYCLGVAVNENYRGRGLATEAIRTGLSSLKDHLFKTGVKKFYLEALVANTNLNSIRVAEKIFASKGHPSVDQYTGTPSKLYYMLVNL